MHLYVHVPFCRRRCSYCDFAIAVRRRVPAEAFVDAVLAERDRRVEDPRWAPGARPSTLYLGGGTPSLLDEAVLRRLIAGLGSAWPLAEGAEVTLEANPEDVTARRAAGWRALGINRVSLGVQSFHPPVLRWMHRAHDVSQVERACAELRGAGIDNLSLDLIFGLPPSLGRDWRVDLARGIALGPTHVSLYGLTVEAHTPLARWVDRGRVRTVPDAGYAAEFLEGHRTLAAAGYQSYEVSNAARPGFRSRHNAAYWRRSAYLGLGPAAHSARDRHRQWNERQWEAYRRRVARGESPVSGSEELSGASVALERTYLGLRTSEGLADHEAPGDAVSRWVERGWAVRAGGRVRLTLEGWLRLDSLVGEAAGSG